MSDVDDASDPGASDDAVTTRRRRTYRFGESTLAIEFGDIVTADAEVLVSSDDFRLSMGGGVSAAIRHAAGESIRADTLKHAPVEGGGVVVTTAGALPAKYVFHAISIAPGLGGLSVGDVVGPTVRRCLSLVDALGVRSIALPAIGAGVAEFDVDEVALAMIDVLADDLASRPTPIDVSIFLHGRGEPADPMDVLAFFEQVAKRMPHETIATDGDRTEQRRAVAGEVGADLARQLEELTGLLDRVSKGESTDEIAGAIVDLAARRVQLEDRIPDVAPRAATMFVSYAHEDEDYLTAFNKVLAFPVREGMVTVWTDERIRPGCEWDAEIRSKLESADIIVLMASFDFINSRYVTEVELQTAVERRKKGDVVVIPLVLRACPWQEATGLGAVQALPRGAVPVADWESSDHAWTNIYEEIMTTIRTVAARPK